MKNSVSVKEIVKGVSYDSAVSSISDFDSNFVSRRLYEFALVNVSSHQLQAVWLNYEAGKLIRDEGERLSRLNPNFEQDLALFCVGFFESDRSLRYTSFEKPVFVPWDSWKRPETVVSAPSSQKKVK